jgi:outer membrane receptor protein involved in Fe transport
MMLRFLATCAFVACATFAHAQGVAQPAQPAQPSQDQQPTDEVRYEEQVVVSASRTEQQLVNAPAAISLITNETIQNSPATNVGDLLRSVPGINVSQISARDINLTTRGATSTLSTSQLALVDGRSIYLDFFGMVMWDLVPTNPHDIKQIEVIRGPASAVWGANAMSGVVNVITKSPRELAANRPNALTIGVGTFDTSAQDVDRDAGSLFYVNGSHAGAPNSQWSYKLSAGYFTQDPLPRPIGNIPNAATIPTPYPSYVNTGTSQPKFDARVDYDAPMGGKLVLSGGVAGTEGIIHSGIGPFDISEGSRLTYFTGRYERGRGRVAFFTNLLKADAINLLSRGVTGQFLPLDFDTKTFDIEATDSLIVANRHNLTFGANFRRNVFEVSIAPTGDNRNEGGGYIQDEIFLNDHFRWVVGGRVDKFSSIENAVFSPRTSLLMKPDASQTFRVSFNRAFRAPSFINNNIDTTILNQVNLSAISPALSAFVFPVRAIGNTDLKQETMDAFEIGYTGVIRRRATVTAAVYWNRIEDAIFFTQIASYSPSSPPPTWPTGFPTFPLALIPAPGLPSAFSYRNLGTVKDKGIELGIDASLNRYVNAFTNYSFQADPDVENFDPSETNFPANHRFNIGFDASAGRYLGNFSVNHTSSAYWQDVLDQRFAGRTDAYTLVNGAFGVRWFDDRITTSIKVNNLANEEVQQHIFGDIMKRQVLGEARFAF